MNTKGGRTNIFSLLPKRLKCRRYIKKHIMIWGNNHTLYTFFSRDTGKKWLLCILLALHSTGGKERPPRVIKIGKKDSLSIQYNIQYKIRHHIQILEKNIPVSIGFITVHHLSKGVKSNSSCLTLRVLSPFSLFTCQVNHSGHLLSSSCLPISRRWRFLSPMGTSPQRFGVH